VSDRTVVRVLRGGPREVDRSRREADDERTTRSIRHIYKEKTLLCYKNTKAFLSQKEHRHNVCLWILEAQGNFHIEGFMSIKLTVYTFPSCALTVSNIQVA
jgi:hypothetical protein